MTPVLTATGRRCIVPDLIGFGRSDKSASMEAHTYKFHFDTMAELVKALDLREATFVGQDWGSLIGLRVVAENEERFARAVIGNAGLPVGRASGPEPWSPVTRRILRSPPPAICRLPALGTRQTR